MPQANWINRPAAVWGAPATAPRRCRTFARRLQKARRGLGRRYRELGGYNRLAPAERLLAEHYLQLDQAAVDLLAMLSGARLPLLESGMPVWAEILGRAALDPEFPLTREGMTELIEALQAEGRPLTNAEQDFTLPFLRAGAVVGMWEALRNQLDAARAERAIAAFFAGREADGRALNEATNRLEALLRRDPTGDYARQDERTRALYRGWAARAALFTGRDELLWAEDCLREAEHRREHIGFSLKERFEAARPRRFFARYQFRLLAVLPAVAALLLAGWAGNPLWALLFYFPCWELLRPGLERLALRGREPDYLPRLESGADPLARSLFVLAALLPGEPGMEGLRGRLEELLIACPEQNAGVCLLADLPPAREPKIPGDEPALAALARIVEELSARYGGRLVCLVRERVYSPTGREYSGWERKRGAVEALVARIRAGAAKGEEPGLLGNAELLQGVRYLLTLDADTGLTPDCLPRLVAIAEHPMNRPVAGERLRRIVRGYGVLVPRIVPALPSSLRSPFTRVFCGIGGVSGYDASCSEWTQDLYGEGLFTGKGLLRVETYAALLPGRFLPETVLSHDILEGGILRAGFVGDVELTDGFPKDAPAYWKRMHRWTRGDFQNAPLLFARPHLLGGRGETPFSPLCRFCLFDNLRRALLPVHALLILLAGLACRLFAPDRPAAVGICVALALLVPVWGDLYAVWRMLAGGGFSSLALRFYSGILPKSAECLSRAAAKLLLLPRTAGTLLDGAARGLWRRLVSRRRMLEWTTAAQADGGRRNAGELVRLCLLQFLVGVVLLAGGSALRLLGTAFLLAPGLLCILQLPTREPRGGNGAPLPESERERLLGELQRMLAYYDDLATEAEHFLPPDNVQFAPVYRVARRTSPTNIGMMLLAYLAARDCELLSTARLFEVCGRVADTLERLENFHGNLYNWYDTATLAVLPPGFVSTVDSGNLLCCLCAVEEGLKSYLGEPGANPGLPGRLRALIERAELCVFYDRRRALFSIGWDSEAGALSPSHYDMLMSEARMASYFAIASRQVPSHHWAALSRSLSRHGLHAGPKSWTGTMFEYYMPELLLHSGRGSLGFEALEYCLRRQKSRMRRERSGTPWGTSESGVYAFDAALNYQYRPNGVQDLALKRGMDEETTAAPYASYLALSHDPQGALKNLRRFERLGARGRYGYYEAVDFTPSRTGEARFQVVQSFMAHHIGMSIAAIGNLLCGGLLQRRFLRSRGMRRAEALLSEKITGGEFVFQDLFRRKRREFSRAAGEDEYEYVGHLFPQQPRVRLLANAGLCAVVTDVGASYLRVGRTDLTRRPNDLLRAPMGTFAFVRIDGDTVPLCYAPSYRADVDYETAFSKSGVLYTAQTAALSAKTEVRLHCTLPVEQRTYTLQNRRNSTREAVLLLYAEPSLFPREDDDAHRSFSKLFIHAEFREEEQAALFTRRRRGRTEDWCLAMGFLGGAACDFFGSREDVFDRPDILHPKESAFTLAPEAAAPPLPDPCAGLRVRSALGKGEVQSITLLTCAGRTPEEALGYLRAVRRDGGVSPLAAAKSSLAHGSLEHRVAQVILPQALFGKRDSSRNLNAISENTLSPRALWRFGISGDFPLVVCEVYSELDTGRVSAYAACHAAMKLAFVETDLVFLYDGKPAARRAIEDAVEARCGGGVFGGRAALHLLDGSELDPDRRNLLLAAACHIATRSLIRIEAPARPYLPLSVRPVLRAAPTAMPEVEVEGGFFAEGRFFVTQPPRSPWCHILANPTFGTLVSDRALGFTWAMNSQENKLTPWWNDPLRDNTGELLLLRLNGDCRNLVDGALAEFAVPMGNKGEAYARWTGRAGELATEVKATVPARGMVKYLDVTLRNEGSEERELTLCYYTEPCLGVNRQHARQFQGQLTQEGPLLLQNPFQSETRGYAALSMNGEAYRVANDRPAFWSGEWEQVAVGGKGRLLPTPDPCAALWTKRTIGPRETWRARFLLSFGATREGALALHRLLPHEPFRLEHALTVSSGDRSLDLLANGWLPWQTIAGRLFGRTGFYQNGGAYGFRDQIQDVCGVLPLAPSLAKRQILRCAAVQFEEGDVLHWWHVLPRSGGGTRGVRTRYSDDPVWLPWATARYVEATGDGALLHTRVRYLRAQELAAEEHDRYLLAEPSETAETVYGHGKRALARALRLGRHGLVKIGGGDWNDGYNRVGIRGEGESVWLTQFLAMTLRDYAPLCRKMGEEEQAAYYERAAGELLAAADTAGWDGEWYRRGYYDNGQPMGSAKNNACKIDSLPQSFAALADMPDPARRAQAVRSAIRWLVDEPARLIRLFAPPFEQGAQEPGYVKAYPPGVRENGGQYTHAAVWLAMAAGREGMEAEFSELTRLLDPIRRAQIDGARYRLEPYYLAGDISAHPQLFGRGGWSLYTGAAGWYWRLLVEERLGLRYQNGGWERAGGHAAGAVTLTRADGSSSELLAVDKAD